MTGETYDIVIVGSGLSGTALAIELTQRLPAGRIALIGRRGDTGRGIAYHADNRDLYLNVPADRLSLDPNGSDDFVRWLERNHGTPPPTFATRADYGSYVHERLLQAVATASPRMTVDLIEGTAVSLAAAGDAFGLRLANGERLTGRVVALCLGNAPPRFRIAASAVEDRASGRMIADPWNDARMASIGNRDRVLLVGAGLTMVDQIVRLHGRGHTGPITAISRHGRLPATHAAPMTPPANLDLSACGGRLVALFRAVVAAIRSTEAAGGDWRAVIDGLRPHTQQLWQGLSAAEQRSFLRHAESYWAVGRHRMAPTVARRLDEIRAGGNVRIAAARMLAVRAGQNALMAAIRDRATRVVRLEQFDWIVNCTGPGGFPSLAANPLVASLVGAGLARPDRLHVSLDVDADCAVISPAGVASPTLFAVGPVTMGRFFESTAVREIREQAAALAKRLAAGSPTAERATANGPRGALRHLQGRRKPGQSPTE